MNPSEFPPTSGPRGPVVHIEMAPDGSVGMQLPKDPILALGLIEYAKGLLLKQVFSEPDRLVQPAQGALPHFVR